jgi:hypothetical protein
MPSVKKEATVDSSAQAAFDTVQQVLPGLGYEIWKTRPMAYLTQARGTHDGAPLTLNIMASMMPPTRITITAASDDLDEDALAAAAEAILQRLSKPE